MSTLDIYINALQQAGHRVTSQRRAICEYLAETDAHPTPYQVYADIAHTRPEISRATVYNTLNVLQNLGVIVELAFGADHTHYDTDPTPHINLICQRCHTIVDYHDALPLTEIEAQVSVQTGFQPVTSRMDILGFCRACRERRREEIVAQWHARHALHTDATGDDQTGKATANDDASSEHAPADTKETQQAPNDFPNEDR